MQALFDYIISTENRYNNVVDVDDKKLVVNTEITERDYMFVNRIGKVISVPVGIKTEVSVGDEIIVHHNVFRRWLNQQQEERNSASYLDEDKYTVAADQVFAYKKDKKWIALPGYCFVAPIKIQDKWALETDENLKGELVYTNSQLSSLGVSIGDVVGFTPNSEYEFNIDGQKLYRILSNHITINYGPKKKNNTSGGKSIS